MINIMLHLPCPTASTLWIHVKDKTDGGRQGTTDIFLPTSSSLRISDWPQVSRSCRVWDQKLSSLLKAPWLRGGLINLWQCRNQNMRAAQQSGGWCCIQSSMGNAVFMGCQAEESHWQRLRLLFVCLETAPFNEQTTSKSRPQSSLLSHHPQKKKEDGNLGAWVIKIVWGDTCPAFGFFQVR